MFFTMTPEMIKKFTDLQKKKQDLPPKPTMTFNQYYNKMFLEEAKYFVENPKISMKYMMVMTHLQKTIKERSLKEYKEKYPGYPIDEPKQMSTHDEVNVNEDKLDNVVDNVDNVNEDKVANVNEDETESVMSEYDIIDENTISNELNCVEEKPLRRSKRLQTKII